MEENYKINKIVRENMQTIPIGTEDMLIQIKDITNDVWKEAQKELMSEIQINLQEMESQRKEITHREIESMLDIIKVRNR